MTIPLEASAPRAGRRFRGTLAVLAGLAANVVLGLGIDQVLHATGVYPPWGQPMSDGLFGLATAYRLAIGIFSGWLVARLAPDRPMWHAIVLGVIGTLLSAAGAAATWNAVPQLGPKWYSVLLILTAIPCTWLGAKVYLSRRGAA